MQSLRSDCLITTSTGSLPFVPFVANFVSSRVYWWRHELVFDELTELELRGGYDQPQHVADSRQRLFPVRIWT